MQDSANNVAYSENRGTRLDAVPLGGFNMDQAYGNGRNDTADFYIPVTLRGHTDGATLQTFHAKAARCWGDDCWNGGWWEVLNSDQTTTLAGGMLDLDEDGVADGVVDNMDDYTDFATGESAVVVHIHVSFWGNNIGWELSSTRTGEVEGFGPSENPIFLGGHAPFREGSNTDGHFIGNIANVYIFDRGSAEDDINCLHRYQSTNIGSCRAPDGMWRTTLWEPFTDGDNLAEGLRLQGAATIAPNGAGLDLTSNSVGRQMGGGTYYWMDGLGRAGTLNEQLLTPELCISTCQTDGYQYAGLQWGQECFCDNDYDSLGVQDPIEARDAGCFARGPQGDDRDARDVICNAAADTAACDAVDDSNYCRWSEAYGTSDGCAEPCLGDTTKTCGGGLSNAVFDTATNDYKGCYKDTPIGAARVTVPEDYAQDATFTISFWFTKGYCGATNATSRFEPIYYEGGEWCNATAHPEADCKPSRIGVFLACGINTTAGDNQMTAHTFMIDDSGQRFSFDVPLNNARSGGSMTDTWIHYAMAVGGDTVTPYIDGRPERNIAISDWWNNPSNLAWYNSTGMSQWDMRRRNRDGKIQLSQPLTGMNFTGTRGTTLGFAHGHSGSRYYNGYIAGLGIYGREISDAEVSCLYKYGETHLGIPPL